MAFTVLLASCSKDDNEANVALPEDLGAAYISIAIQTPTSAQSRAWTAPAGSADETGINELYLVTFNAAGELVQHHMVGTVGQLVSTDVKPINGVTKSEPVKVAPTTTQLLIVANPGTELKKVLMTAVGGGVASFGNFNQMLTVAYDRDSQTPGELVNEMRGIASGSKAAGDAAYQYFTMINSGSFAGGAVDGENVALVPVTRVAVVGSEAGQYATEAEAITAAQDNATSVKIERMTSKIQVDASDLSTVLKVSTAKFELPADGKYWTLDVLNSKYFPYATKINSTTTGAVQDFYNWAFYTKDPNYENNALTPSGLKYNTLVAGTLAPNTTWLADGLDYAIENTMDADAQFYKYATRIVVKGHYWPVSTWTGDWFRYAGTNYEKLADIQAKYVEIRDTEAAAAAASKPANAANQAFLTACDNFVKMVVAQAGALTVTIDATSATKFNELKQVEDLDKIVNGGELVKNSEGCIRWYQGGLNYWYYEIRHDDGATGTNVQNKYGVVRNNWYTLKLSSVTGHGTPWYPSVVPDEERPTGYDDKEYDPTDPTNPDPLPDPKDPTDPTPDPEDPIDKESGYMAFEIVIAPWISWTHDMPLN